jgi:xanthine dehydrogenase accessory factor
MSALSEELARISEQGGSAVLATIVEAEGDDWVEAGAKCLVVDGKVKANTVGDTRVLQAIVRDSGAILNDEKSKLVAIQIPDGGKLQVFFEVMLEPPKLIVVGAGHIAVPLVQIAKVLDFHVTVIDDRLL